jgi:hypothetical protein
VFQSIDMGRLTMLTPDREHRAHSRFEDEVTRCLPRLETPIRGGGSWR